EVMIAGASAPAVVAVVTDVLANVERHAILGSARAGIAKGPAIGRDGDYFGPVVNLAARLAKAAEPGDVFVNDAVRDALIDDDRLEDAGKFALKGFDEPVAVTRLRLG